jgi:dynactin-6
LHPSPVSTSLSIGTIVHPKATIFAVGGEIIIGSNNIIEEGAIIVNRRREAMRIGDLNLFSVHSRIESPSVGDFNTFSPRSQTSSTTRVTDCCTVGAGCTLIPRIQAGKVFPEEEAMEEDEVVGNGLEEETLQPYTVLYLTGEGDAGRVVNRRVWDGRGEAAERDMRIKQAEYLREVSLPALVLTEEFELTFNLAVQMLPRVCRVRAP